MIENAKAGDPFFAIEFNRVQPFILVHKDSFKVTGNAKYVPEVQRKLPPWDCFDTEEQACDELIIRVSRKVRKYAHELNDILERRDHDGKRETR